eukprot:4333764-Alexandrium_andersonii.AAC.1
MAFCLTAWPPQSLIAGLSVASVGLGQITDRLAEPRRRDSYRAILRTRSHFDRERTPERARLEVRRGADPEKQQVKFQGVVRIAKRKAKQFDKGGRLWRFLGGARRTHATMRHDLVWKLFGLANGKARHFVGDRLGRSRAT